MIVRIIIGILLLLAIASLVLGLVSYHVPRQWGTPITRLRLRTVEDGASFGFYDGFLGFWLSGRVWTTSMTYGECDELWWRTFVRPAHGVGIGRSGAYAMWHVDCICGPGVAPATVVPVDIRVRFQLAGSCVMWACLFAFVPIVVFVRNCVRRYTRRRRHLCVKCAYNLTGNVSGVCPECGTEIAKPG